MLISEEYKEEMQKKHEASTSFGSDGGDRWSKVVAEVSNEVGTRDILDYGAGKGSLSCCLPAYNVVSYDPAVPKFNHVPFPHDIVACLDVLEHVEPDCLDEVIKDLARLTKKNLITVVNVGPAMKTLSDGRNAHLIQEDYRFWIPLLDKHFGLVQFNNFGVNILMVWSKRVLQ